MAGCVCAFGWFVPYGERMVTHSVSSTAAVTLYILAFDGFSKEAYISTQVLQWSKLVAIWVHIIMRHKTTVR